MTTLFSISTCKFSRKLTRPFDDGDPPKEDDLQAKIDAAVEAATAPLKQNRDTILEEKRKAVEDFKKANSILGQLGGEEGIKSLIELQKKTAGDETLQRIQKGEWQEVFQEKNQELIKSYEGKLKEQQEAVAAVKASEQEAHNKYVKKMREVEVLSVTAASEGFQKAATPDVMARAEGVFNHFNEETGRQEIRDKDGVVKIGKDGVSPYSVEDWLEAQKEPCAHWWAPSKGSNASGSSSGGPTGGVDTSKMSFEEFEAYRQAEMAKKKKPY
jgi:hypothetical protein